jgi:hypothetical protein
MIPQVLSLMVATAAAEDAPAPGTPAPATSEATAGVPRKELPPNPRAQWDFTAHALGKGQWRVGLLYQDYGLTPQLSVGTAALGWLLGPNARAKATLWEGKRVDVSADAGVWQVDLSRLQLPAASTAQVTPLGWRASWVVGPRWSLHAGQGWVLGRVTGNLTDEQISAGINRAVGVDALGDALGGSGVGAYVDARLTLLQGRFGSEWRFNRQNSLVFQSNAFVRVDGIVAGGFRSAARDGTSAGVGASAQVQSTLSSLPNATSLAWHWSKERFNLRLGIPLEPSNPRAWMDTIQVFWLLGPTPAPKPLPDRRR